MVNIPPDDPLAIAAGESRKARREPRNPFSRSPKPRLPKRPRVFFEEWDDPLSLQPVTDGSTSPMMGAHSAAPRASA